MVSRLSNNNTDNIQAKSTASPMPGSQQLGPNIQPSLIKNGGRRQDNYEIIAEDKDDEIGEEKEDQLYWLS